MSFLIALFYLCTECLERGIHVVVSAARSMIDVPFDLWPRLPTSGILSTSPSIATSPNALQSSLQSINLDGFNNHLVKESAVAKNTTTSPGTSKARQGMMFCDSSVGGSLPLLPTLRNISFHDNITVSTRAINYFNHCFTGLSTS
jgi:hypothetical protein